MNVKVNMGPPPVVPQALLQIDIDNDAERIVIFDRFISKFHYMLDGLQGGSVVNVILPIDYATKNDLVVCILDNDLNFAVKAVDGVQPDIINGAVTNIFA